MTAPDAPGEAEILAELPRPGFRGSPAEALRVTIDVYAGHKFVAFRVWRRGAAGWYATQRGVSIRAGELLSVIAALRAAARALGLEDR